MINASLLSSKFPVEHNHAVVTPIVKKPGLDAAQLASYRPISNLSFVSKLLERTVAGQVRTYLDENDLFPPLQSAYRPKHSTETALLKVFDNAYMAADDGMVTLVVLLDFSAAFDTVDHDIALSILRDSHRLKLNASKSEVIWIGSSQQLAHLTEDDKQLVLPDGTTITASTSFPNLGVQIDENLRMDEQVAMCRRSCYYHIRRIRRYQTSATPPGLIVTSCTRGGLRLWQDRLL